MNGPQGGSAADASSRDEGFRYYEGWQVVAVCFLIATFAWAGGFYGQGVYLAELHRVHGWPTSRLATATTCYYLFSAILVAFVSEALRVLGPRRLLLIGIGCMAAGTALVGQVTAVWQLYLVYAAVAFGWAGTSVAAINNTLGLWFDKRRGTAISLALNGASCGGVFGVPLLVEAIGRFGLSATSIGAGAIMIALAVPAILLWVGQPPKRVSTSDPSSSMSAPSPAQMRRGAFGSLRFWTIAIPFALILTAQVGFIVHLIVYLDPIIGRVHASFAVSLMTAMAVIGRLLLGFIANGLDQRKVAAASAVSQTLALIVVTATQQEALIFAACMVFGFSVGNMITLPSMIVQREFSAEAFGLIVSLVTAMCQFTYAFGPGLIGLLRDVFGGYSVPFLVCAILDLAAAIIVLMRSGPSRT